MLNKRFLLAATAILALLTIPISNAHRAATDDDEAT